MTGKARLPVGIEDFGQIRKEEFYYIDKTRLIKDLLENMSYVTLFTRPRRFGKTLNMSMLKNFFEAGSDSTLFDGLEIVREREICEKYMGKFPVISISLKGAVSSTFEGAKKMLCNVIGKEALRFPFLMQSSSLSETERRQYKALIHVNDDGVFAMTDELLMDSLLLLSCCLEKHFGQKTIILIDEYDVPLDRAYQAGWSFFVDRCSMRII